MIDRQTAFSGTREPSPGLELNPKRLIQYLEVHVDGFRGPVALRQFKGGQSNPTYRLETQENTYVLRRKPPGKLLPSAHAIEREYRVMRALFHAGFPVPRVRCLCERPEVAGTAFYVMDFIAGRIVWEPVMPGFAPIERGTVYEAMVATLADLHSFDPSAIGLHDFGRGRDYVARQIARWSAQYRASQTEDIAEMDRLIDWLPAKVPEQQRLSVVHGDFRLDNVILAADRPDIRAVIDWELATLGDPVADFTNFLMQWRMPPSETGTGFGSLVGRDLDPLGIPQLDTLVSRYEALTELHVRPHLDFYLAYNFFRIAAILQGIAGRVRDGTATSENAAEMGAHVRPIAEAAWEIAAAGTA